MGPNGLVTAYESNPVASLVYVNDLYDIYYLSLIVDAYWLMGPSLVQDHQVFAAYTQVSLYSCIRV